MGPNATIDTRTDSPREDQWLPDPSGRHQFRWWGGGRWTDAVADGSVTGTDPLAAPPAPSGPSSAGPSYAGPAGSSYAGQAPVAAQRSFAGAPPVVSTPYAGPRPMPVPKPARRRPVVGTVVAGVASVLAVVGAFLPWATISGVTELSISGTEDGRDGVITLTLALMVLALTVVMGAARSRAAAIFVTIFGALVALIAVYDTSNVRGVDGFGDVVQVGVGAGLWVTLVAGIAMVVGGIAGIARR